MSRPAPLQPASITSDACPNTGMLLRKCSCGNNSKGGTCDECKDKEDEGLQRKAAGPGRAHDAPPIVHDVLQGQGEALPAAARADMEQRFGHDFANVRVHTDARAAESARAVHALAYTVGQHVVFGANRFAPGSTEGRHLLAHELAHTLQQRGTTARRQNRLVVRGSDSAEERAADRAADAAVRGAPVFQYMPAAAPGVLQKKDAAADPCDDTHREDVAKAAAKAQEWLSSVSQWFEAHLALIKRRTPKGAINTKVGDALFGQLSILNRHFRYADIVEREWKGRFPDSPNWEGSFKDFETLGRASHTIRTRFNTVKVSSLGVHCQKPCPSGEEGSEVVGSARPGSGEYTIYTDCFDKQSETTKAGVVLHEAFHASFQEFSDDSYEHTKGYPGTSAVKNADSYANFAAVVATGSPFRVTVVPVEISAGPGGTP